jgi:ferredoxin
MIFYFSGTGNTKHCATKLAQLLGEKMSPITVAQLRSPNDARLSTTDKRVIWMFPIYSWGIPKEIANMLKRATFNMPEDSLHWMVTTCGDDIGLTASQWRKLMDYNFLNAASAFSVQMPNTYTFMSGYDVDSEQEANDKIANSEQTLTNIAKIIERGEPVKDQVVKGSFAWFKSKIVYPLFNLFCTSPRPFYVTDDCTKCGLCRKKCSMENIGFSHSGEPKWKEHCMLCSRCYHICPKHAVQYGSKTKKKGQYRTFIKLTD